MSGLKPTSRGPISWMAQNPVAANLLMVILMLGGILIGSKAKQEVFPEFDLDLILIAVPYPGATPTEVEQGVVPLAIARGCGIQRQDGPGVDRCR